MRARLLVVAALATLALGGCSDQGDAVLDPGLDTVTRFARDVRPILQAHCTVCHTAGGGGQSGLDLSSYAGVMAGSVGGPIVAPHEPDSSRIVQRLESTDPGFWMPLGSPRLGDAQVTRVRDWIEEGALDN